MRAIGPKGENILPRAKKTQAVLAYLILMQGDGLLRNHVRRPLFQVQPLLRQCYQEPPFEVLEITDLRPDDWQRFAATMKPNTDQMRAFGHYAVDTRKRFRNNS